MSVPIRRIVLTGGPCAGKTQAQGLLREHLEKLAIRVFTLPEASTLLLSGGIQVREATLEQRMRFQRGIVRMQKALEEAYLDFARALNEPAILLCDRDILDGAAYLPADAWQEILLAEGMTEQELLEQRYHAVLHLRTIAHATTGYGTDTNPTRYEDVAGARQVCDRLREVWQRHPRHRVIDHHPDFTVKMQMLLATVQDLLEAT